MYVPDDMTLGNPGIFGFIGKAIGTVVKAVTGESGPIKITVAPPTPPPPPPQQAGMFGAPGGGVNMQTLALIGGALLLGTILSGRGRRG